MRNKNQMYKWLIGFILLCLIPTPLNAFAAAPETDKIGKVNHYEWDTVCIYASDVVFTVDEIEVLQENGKLAEEVIKAADGEVRKAPKYQLMENGLYGADVSQIEASLNKNGYPVRLYIQGKNEYYIDILLKVTETKTPASDSENTEEITAGESVQHDTEISPGSLQKEGSPISSESSKESGAVRRTIGKRFLIYSVLFLLVGVSGVFFIKKDIHVLRWYAMKLK